MHNILPFRFEPKNLPDDWHDPWLRNAALLVNRDDDIPAVFADDALDYLWELGYALPRRGILFFAAREFIPELAIDTLPDAEAAIVRQVRDLDRRKRHALAQLEFELAVACRDQQKALRAHLTACPVHLITRDEIRSGLLRVGVDPDGMMQ